MTKEECEFILARMEELRNKITFKITITQLLLAVNAIMLSLVIILMVLPDKSSLSIWNRFLRMFGFVPFTILINLTIIYGVKFKKNIYNELLLHKSIIVREAVFVSYNYGAHGPSTDLYIKKNGCMVWKIDGSNILNLFDYKKGEIVLLREGKTNILYPSPKGNCLQNE